MSIPDSLLVGVFGMAVVFLVLIGLNLLVRFQSALITRFTRKKQPEAIEQPKKNVPVSEDEPPVAEAVSISSPVAGTVIELLTSPGARVNHGQTLLILDTLKMEHEIVAPREGVVTKVMKSKGSSVGAGEPIIILQ